MLSNNIRELSFDTKYISGKAKEVLTEPTSNKYIIKGSTGIGGTTAILNNNKYNYIIVSPYVGMIKSKEQHRGKYESGAQYFIYSDTQDNWKNAIAHLKEADGENIIINTTPDQIANLPRELAKHVYNTPLFIDEAHLYPSDANFRDSLGHFMELVYHKWEASFTLSTATPFYKFWDVPYNMHLDVYKVKSSIQPKKHIDISYDKKDIKQFVYEQHEMGRLVAVFTNDKNIHTSFKDLRVANLVGDTLRKKLAPYHRGIALHELDYNNIDVLILSSSYFTGFDLEHDCSILIVNDQSKEACKVNVNNAIQAYGRCRKTVHKALFVNLTKADDNAIEPEEILEKKYYNSYLKKVEFYNELVNHPGTKYIEEFQEYFVRNTYVNRTKLMGSLIDAVDHYQLQNHNVLVHKLQEHNFVVNNYTSENDKLKANIGTAFNERIKNLISYRPDLLLGDYNNIKYNLRNKTDGTYSPKLALEYLTAYLLSLTDAKELISKLNNKRIYAGEFYSYFRTFLAVNSSSKNLLDRPSKKHISYNVHYKNKKAQDGLLRSAWLTDDWQMLYSIYLISSNKLSDKLKRNLLIEQTSHDEVIYLKYVKDSNGNRCKNTRTAIIKRLSDNNILLTKKEEERLKRKIKENFSTLDNGKSFGAYYNEKHIKTNMKEAIIFCLTGGKCGRRKTVDFREYNPFTSLPKSLRSIIPIKYLEIDLSSANAQFVDIILDTNISMEVYPNIMAHYGISRDEAKSKYNTFLNNYKLSVGKASEFYTNAGYPEDKALTLAKLTAKVKKGVFFKTMTEYEELLIEMYDYIIGGHGYRFHDALVVKESIIRENGFVLPTVLMTQSGTSSNFFCDLELPPNREINYHIGYYNNPRLKYYGKTTSEAHNADKPLDNIETIHKLAS